MVGRQTSTSSASGIGERRQLRALASPLRQEIVDALESAGPCSIAELGEHLSRAPDALYFHVKHLVRAGLVKECERKKVGRHAFGIYDITLRPLRIDRAKAKAKDMSRVAGGILRLALRDYERGLSHAGSNFEGPSRNHWVARAQGWLDAKKLTELNEHLESVLRLLRGNSPGPGKSAIAVAFSMTPANPRSRRKPRLPGGTP